MRTTIGKFRAWLIVWLAVANLAIPAASYADGPVEAPFRGYIYNERGESVPSPNGYLPDEAYTGEQLGAGKFNNPQDLFVDDRERIWVLDSGNNRVVVLDRELRVSKTIDVIRHNGQEERLKNPGGIYVTKDGRIYIADTDNRRVVVMSEDGELLQELTKPESELLQGNVEYKPGKVVVDSIGTVYVLCRGIYQGALTFDTRGKFIGFYGSGRVETTLSMLQDYFWKKLLNQTQRSKMARYVPIEYANFDIDGNNFVYTVTSGTDSATNQIRKINPSGMNTMPPGAYGDLETVWEAGKNMATSFVDIHVDNEGFINALDMQRGRLFQYDMDGNLLFIMGGIGQQVGTFKTPVAIDSMQGKLIVLDSAKNNLTFYKPTPYGKFARKAVKLYADGRYEEAVAEWHEVLKRNGNLELAYVGIGKALYGAEQYEESMKYFKLGYDMEGYSDAFKAYRKLSIRTALLPILLTLIILGSVIGYLNYKSKRRKRNDDRKPIEIGTFRYPFYIMLHPVQGYEEMGWTRKGSVVVSLIIVAAWFFASVAQEQWTAFVFNPSRADQLNVWLIMTRTGGLFVLWVTANWALCTLLDGKGKAKDIWIYSAYALMPFIMITVLVTIASHFIARDEGVFLEYAMMIAYGWTVVLLLIAMSVVHEYSLKKTIVSSVLSVVGIGLILFLFVLIFGVFQQLYAFAGTLYREILFRL